MFAESHAGGDAAGAAGHGAAEAAGHVAAEHGAEAAGHAHSIVYGPVNALWEGFLGLTGLDARWGHVSVPDHVAMSLLVLALIMAIFIPMRYLYKKERPGKFQQLLELLVEGLQGMGEDVIGHGGGRRYLPVLGALTVFILISNIAGLFFFLQPPTQNPNTTFALSITAFLFYNWIGIRTHGFGYVKHFMGPVLILAPIFIVVEIISHIARAFSLGVRLYGNIFGEHTVAGQFFGFAPIILPIPIMALGLFGALLQTFIFVMLTAVYIAGAEATEH